MEQDAEAEERGGERWYSPQSFYFEVCGGGWEGGGPGRARARGEISALVTSPGNGGPPAAPQSGPGPRPLRPPVRPPSQSTTHLQP